MSFCLLHRHQLMKRRFIPDGAISKGEPVALLEDSPDQPLLPIRTKDGYQDKAWRSKNNEGSKLLFTPSPRFLHRLRLVWALALLRNRRLQLSVAQPCCLGNYMCGLSC